MAFPLTGLLCVAAALFTGMIFGGRRAGPLALSNVHETLKPAVRPSASGLPYERKPLLTAWERHALLSIRAQLPVGFYVCPQVRLADMLRVDHEDAADQWRAIAKVARKSVDFAVVELTSGNVVLVVELDDQSHQWSERRDRDAFVNSVLDRCGIPIRRFRPDMPIQVADFFESAAAIR
jgi:hypothetical protein